MTAVWWIVAVAFAFMCILAGYFATSNPEAIGRLMLVGAISLVAVALLVR